MSTDAHLLFLPGLGADARLFNEQRKEFPKAEYLRLPAPKPEEPFGEYAKRWADSIEWDKHKVVVGFAFGGVLALEAALHSEEFRKNAGGIILVASCRTKAAVTSGFRRQVALSRMVPQMMLRRLLMSFAERFSEEDDLNADQRQMLRDMALELDLDHLRWASNACCEWDMESTKEIEKDIRVFQIHGEKDLVIPLIEGDADLVLPGAGHLIQYTRPGELNAYIRLCVGELGLTTPSIL